MKNLFNEINNAVLDLQSSQLQTYAKPLKKLAQLLNHPDLLKFNNKIKESVDLDRFLAESKDLGGGMVGSSQLAWPDDQEKELGLTLLLLERFAEDPQFAANFGHQYFYSGKKIIAGIHSINSQLIIPFVRDYKSYVHANGASEPILDIGLSRKVFIVHGHDDGARESVARFLEKIGFEPIILHEQANQGRTVIEKVEAHGDVGFAVVLLTPDDEGSKRGGAIEYRPRQNVLLELGYFMGRLGRERVCALKKNDLEIPSDFAGVVWEDMDTSGGWKLSLARELQAVGHHVDWNKAMGV